MPIGRGGARSQQVVLLVEDNDRIRKAAAEALSGRGYDVRTAASTEEALPLLTGSRIDLLVTDMHLPGALQGMALARRAKESWPDVKIVIVGIDVDQLPATEFPALADDVLRKPFKLSELEERVANLVG
ncbi:MAG TPA: response regulator [Stellaceae bacterium]|nr:response regulator [Stellaceae bacterium]